MHGPFLCVRVMVLLVAVGAAGCLPNRMAVSPDGQTLYFAVNADAQVSGGGNSNVYALEVGSGRIHALSGGPGLKGCCSLSTSGRYLAYSQKQNEGEMVVQIVDLKETSDGNTVAGTGSLISRAYAWLIPTSDAEDAMPDFLVMKPVDIRNEAWEWALIRDGAELPLSLPPESIAVFGNVGLAKDQFALAVWQVTETSASTSEKKMKQSRAVYTMHLGTPQSREATLVATWEGGSYMDRVDLAYTADGKRLVVAVDENGSENPTRFYELDPSCKLPPKVLFEAVGGAEPQWTPEANGIVYIQTNPVNPAWRNVVLRRLDAKEPTVLAHLPQLGREACTAWFWLKDGRLRIYHVSDEGIRLIETGADGKDAKGRLLPHDRLKAQVALADLARALKGFPQAMKTVEPPGVLAEKFSAITAPAYDGIRRSERAMDALWKGAEVWDDVPAMPPVPVPPKATPPATATTPAK